MDPYFIGVLKILLIFGSIRLVILLTWVFKSIYSQNLWLSIFSLLHLLILCTCLWWAFFGLLISAGMSGITPDGTEHRY